MCGAWLSRVDRTRFVGLTRTKSTRRCSSSSSDVVFTLHNGRIEVTTNTLFQRSTLRSLGLAAVTGAIGLSVLLTAGASAESTTMRADGPKPTVVLVHGAWADASSWDGEIRRLQDDGYSVIAPANLCADPPTTPATTAGRRKWRSTAAA